MDIPKERLRKKGYTPIDTLVLYGPGVVIRPTSTERDFTWWTEWPEIGPRISITSTCLADLAKALNLKLHRLQGQSAQSVNPPIFHTDLADQPQGNNPEIVKLYGKIDQGVLNLIAFLNDGDEPCFSSHSGNWVADWSCSIDEVLS